MHVSPLSSMSHPQASEARSVASGISTLVPESEATEIESQSVLGLGNDTAIQAARRVTLEGVADFFGENKDLLAAKGVNFISRVVGVEKLKGKFRGFDARRGLLKDHGLFLADARVVPLLPKLLGSQFFKAKKCAC